MTRRDFLKMLAAASAAGLVLPRHSYAAPDTMSEFYDLPPFGQLTFMHITDCHAQLVPTYFREPSINIGVGEANGRLPHVVGNKLLKYMGFKSGSIYAHAFSHVEFAELAQLYGKIGGFAHLATVVKHLRSTRPGRTLLLDGGDTWQGSATALWTNGQDMIDATKLLGVDIMTGHWEFTYGADRVKEVIEKDFKGNIEFVAQNIVDKEFGDPIFKPYTLREVNGISVGVIGQAFPYTPVANPGYMVPDWTFGIQEDRMQKMADEVRAKGAQIVVLLSHGGMDSDFKIATRVTGIDLIMGGHTHDALPAPHVVSNAKGKTLVMHSGCNGKFLSVLDLEIKDGKIKDYEYRLLPIFSNLIPPDKAMSEHIAKVRAPFKAKLEEKLGITEELLYRRGNFNGTSDQMIVEALREIKGTDFAFSPGFRWGATLLPGEAITMEHLMNLTAITYPIVTTIERSGEELKFMLEDIADNLFNTDPYMQQGGDMVRTGALRYVIDPNQVMGKRILRMEDGKGKLIDPNKKYSIATWGGVGPQPEGVPVWDVVAEYLRHHKSVKIKLPNTPKVVNIADNPGLDVS
ncbi:MAG: thiosulfohydrolase SoxB [Gammaproteobacteria bacterium]|nr:thiosulfohydrolase SoxB [Gammaproteobacteria bacterium]